MSIIKPWLTEDEAAAWLDVPVEAVRSAIRRGELPSLKVGGHVRINSAGLLTAAVDRTQAVAHQITESLAAMEESAGGIPVPAGMRWTKEIEGAEAFDFHWPAKRGESYSERYDPSWEASFTLLGEHISVRVGVCERLNRGRMTVFFGNLPICEFVETTVGDGWASVIKPDGKKVLPAGATPPPLYRNAHVEPYREVVSLTGSGVPRGQAVVIAKDDLRSAIHHAAARWLGKRHHAVEPREAS